MRAGLIQPEPLSAAAVWLDQGVSVTWIDLGVEWSRCSAVKDEGPIKRDYSITPKHISRSSIRLNLPPPPQTLALSLSLSLSLSLLCFLPPVDVGRRSARRSFCLGAPSSALTSPSGTHADRRVRPLPPPRLCSPLPSCGGDGGDGDYEHNFLLVCLP